jgi:hypothetical protein
MDNQTGITFTPEEQGKTEQSKPLFNVPTLPPRQQAQPSQPAEKGISFGPEEVEEKDKSPLTGKVGPALRHAEQKPDMTWGETFYKAAENAPASAYAYGEALAYPFLHPQETYEGVKALGKGLYSKAAGALGAKQEAGQKAQDEAAADAVYKFYADRYGSMDGFKNAVANDPVGVLADAASVFTLGGGTAAKLPGVLGQAGKAVATVGSAVDPLNITAQGVKLGTKAATAGLSIPEWWSTGASLTSLNNAAKAGLENNKTFLSHLTGSADSAEAVRRIEDIHSQIAKERKADLNQRLSSIANTELSYEPVQRAIESAYRRIAPQGIVLYEDAAQKLGEAQRKLNQYMADPNIRPNVATMQELKEAFRDIGSDRALGNIGRSLLGEVANTARDQIAALPRGVGKTYMDAMEKYAEQSRQLANIRYAFLGGGADASKIRKILASKDNYFKTNMLEEMAKYDPDLPFIVAGMELNPVMPSGLRGQISGALAGLGAGNVYSFAHGLAAAAAHSPRVIGSAQYGLGYAGGLPARAVEAAPFMATLPFQAGRALQEEQYAREGRATGGKVVGSIAQRLVASAEKAHKYHQKTTEEILDAPDEAVVKALAVAKKHI